MMLGPGALQYPRVLSAMGSIVICVLKNLASENGLSLLMWCGLTGTDD